MQIRFAGHWLAFLWEVTEGARLTEAVRQAKSAGASVFELIHHALNHLSPMETVVALKEGGMERATMCIFYPDGADGAPPPMGDPLGDGQDFDKAVETFRQTLTFMRGLQLKGIDINLVVGPSCWVLGKKYEGMRWPEKKNRILTFYGALKDQILAAKARVAVELLRDSEDCVLQSVDQWIDLIDGLNASTGTQSFGAHWDSVHMRWRKFDLVYTIQKLGGRILHLHLNGDDRRPAGGDGDTVNWRAVISALKDAGLNGLTATNEPFCQVVRDNCPPLGEGLPPAVSEPGGMITTRETLEKCGVTILA